MAKKLTAGQKAAATRKKNAAAAKRATTRAARTAPVARVADYVKVEYGRPGINGLKGSLVEEGTTHEEAMQQAGVEINPAKEQLLDKDTGSNVRLVDEALEGTFMIVPGVDSSVE